MYMANVDKMTPFLSLRLFQDNKKKRCQASILFLNVLQFLTVKRFSNNISSKRIINHLDFYWGNFHKVTKNH